MRRHPTDIVSLVLGLVFLGEAGAWVAWERGLVDAHALSWLVPAVLVVAGLVGAAVSLRPRR